MHIVPCGLAVSAERRARFRFNGKITSRRIQMKPNMPRKVVTISHLGPPSKVLIDVADELTGLPQYPVLDVGCGFGRNAVALTARGLSVVCVDQDLGRLQTLVRLAPSHIAELKQTEGAAGQLYPLLAKLNRLRWPFAPKCFGAIICVHFLDVELIAAGLAEAGSTANDGILRQRLG
jgi:SAM-dependent methyltransferase